MVEVWVGCYGVFVVLFLFFSRVVEYYKMLNVFGVFRIMEKGWSLFLVLVYS